MSPEGFSLIGGEAVAGVGTGFRAIAAATGQPLEPEFTSATLSDLDRACGLALDAFGAFHEVSPGARATLLETIGREIEALGEPLIERGVLETGLPAARLRGERGRTVGQLNLFAEVLRAGEWLEVRIDTPDPERLPQPRPDLRQRQVPLGPVAVFGASNFPLAFSVAGGDTASALAAGCTVVVKAHPAHPGVSEMVGRAVQKAVAACGLPPGVFALLHDSGLEVAQALVADRRIRAVGFTGSRRGGLALVDIAARRPEPIPVYAEMSSVNPVILMPGALAARGEAIAAAFVASLTLGAGQFCTNPGLILALAGPDLDRFVEAAASAARAAPPQVMLTPGIRAAYADGLKRMDETKAVQTIDLAAPVEERPAAAALFRATSAALRANPSIANEMFGAAAVIVECADLTEISATLESLEGQLTVAVHLDDTDIEEARRLLPIMERKAGRVLANGFGTGVEVSHAMVHGGPYPATSDGRSTSVGSQSIRRFLRAVCYQDLPGELLPEALRSDNPQALPRWIDGRHRPA